MNAITLTRQAKFPPDGPAAVQPRVMRKGSQGIAGVCAMNALIDSCREALQKELGTGAVSL